MNWITAADLFRCRHSSMSRVWTNRTSHRSYQVCLWCGAEFRYNWREMVREDRVARPDAPISHIGEANAFEKCAFCHRPLLGCGCNNVAGSGNPAPQALSREEAPSTLPEIVEQFIRWATPLAEMAQTQWADDNDLSQPCHWLNETIKDARLALRVASPDAGRVREALLQTEQRLRSTLDLGATTEDFILEPLRAALRSGEEKG